MRTNKHILAIGAFSIVVMFCSCGDGDDILPQNIMASPAELNFEYNDSEGKSFTLESLNVTGISAPQVSDSWITVTTNDNSLYLVQVENNMTGEYRVGTVSFTSSAGDIEVEVFQKVDPAADAIVYELVDCYEPEGNADGTFVLEFYSENDTRQLVAVGATTPQTDNFVLLPGTYDVQYNSSAPIAYTLEGGYIDVFFTAYGTTEIEYTTSGGVVASFMITSGTMDVSLAGSIYTIDATFTGEYVYRRNDGNAYKDRSMTITRKYTYMGVIDFPAL